jgi:hypothetical protein
MKLPRRVTARKESATPFHTLVFMRMCKSNVLAPSWSFNPFSRTNFFFLVGVEYATQTTLFFDENGVAQYILRNLLLLGPSKNPRFLCYPLRRKALRNARILARTKVLSTENDDEILSRKQIENNSKEVVANRHERGGNIEQNREEFNQNTLEVLSHAELFPIEREPFSPFEIDTQGLGGEFWQSLGDLDCLIDLQDNPDQYLS